MLQTNTLIDTYIDANIVLLFAYLVWQTTRSVVGRTKRRHDFILHLKLTEALILIALLSPLLAFVISSVSATMFPETSLNATDFAVAQFLDGRVSMDAERFEALLSTRKDLVEQIAGLQTPLAKTVAALFATGFLVSAALTLRSILCLNRLIRDSYVWRRFGRLELRISDDITVPFSTRGLFNRYIIVPSSILARPTELRIALAHELQHMRRHDTEWELALVLLKPLFFWNPAFVHWKKGLEHLRELGCDQILLQRNRVTPRAYADCLISVCDSSISRKGTFNLVTPKVPFVKVPASAMGQRNYRVLRDRVEAITRERQSFVFPAFFFWPMVVAAMFVIALGATALKRPADWSQDRLMLSTIVNLERLETRNSGMSLAGY